MPRGHSLKTPERLAEVLRLHAQNVSYQEIADRLGLTYKTVWTWIDDPDGSKLKTRKDGYRVPCEVCGTLTDGSVGRQRERAVCCACQPGVDEIWTSDAILLAIQEWADEHGGIPPSSNDFQRDKRAGAPLPSVNEVCRHFGLWNDAIRAAGYEPHHGGPIGGFTTLTEEQRRECVARYAAGESSVDISADLGCAANTVLKWVRAAGLEVRPNFIDAARRAA